MLTASDRIERFANRLDKNLRRDERSKTSMRVVTACHFNVALEECGFRRRGEKNVALIETALARRQIYATPPITDPDVQFDQLLHFSRIPPDPTQTGYRRLRFPVEREFESFVVANFDFLFEDLKLVKRQFPLTSGNKVDIMARHRESGDWVVLELKVAEQDRGTPSQIVGYMEEVQAQEKAKRSLRGVRGIVLTVEPNPTLTGHLADLAEARGFDIKWFVCQVEMSMKLSTKE